MSNTFNSEGGRLRERFRSREEGENLLKAVEVLKTLFNIREEIRVVLKDGIERNADRYVSDIYLQQRWPEKKLEILRRIAEISVGEGGFLSFESGKKSGEICLNFSQPLGRSVGSGGHYSEYEQRLRHAGAIVASVRRSQTTEYGKNVSLRGKVTLKGDSSLIEEAASFVRDELQKKEENFISEVDAKIARAVASDTAIYTKRKEDKANQRAVEDEQRLAKLAEANREAEKRKNELQEELAFLSEFNIIFSVDASGRRTTLTLPSRTSIFLTKRTPTFSDPDIWRLEDTSEFPKTLGSSNDPKELIKKYLLRNRP